MDTTDAAIQKEIVDALERDCRIDVSDVTVAVAEGHVILKGTIYSLLGRIAAAQIAAAVPGVIGIGNRISVNFTPVAPRLPAPTGKEKFPPAGEILKTLGRAVNSIASPLLRYGGCKCREWVHLIGGRRFKQHEFDPDQAPATAPGPHRF